MSELQKSAGRTHSSVKDMTVGNPYTQMLIFTLPVLLSQIFQQLYNTADAFIVGRVLGTNALAAVSSSGNLIFLMTSFFYGTAMGGGKGYMFGTILGCIFLTSLSTGFNLMNVNAYYQQIIKGLIILGAVCFDIMSKKISK